MVGSTLIGSYAKGGPTRVKLNNVTSIIGATTKNKSDTDSYYYNYNYFYVLPSVQWVVVDDDVDA